MNPSASFLPITPEALQVLRDHTRALDDNTRELREQRSLERYGIPQIAERLGLAQRGAGRVVRGLCETHGIQLAGARPTISAAELSALIARVAVERDRARTRTAAAGAASALPPRRRRGPTGSGNTTPPSGAPASCAGSEA